MKRIKYFSFIATAIILLNMEISAQMSKVQKYYQGTPVNPLINQMINEVSTDSIFSYLETLVSFETRHINSDTTSATVGIGAARNFIFNKFQQFSNQSGGEVDPSFFVFSANACGITNNAHKNVLATISGNYTAERYFIASGHMDSRTIDNCDNTAPAPGANDDGSGTVASIEMARILSNYSDEMESSLILMAVTGEEQGLIGSTAYAEWALANNLRIDGMITNDIIGNIKGCIDPACPNGNFIIDSTSVRHFSGGESTSSSRQFTRYMKLKAEQYVTEVDWIVNLIPFLDRPGRGGDHIAFFNNGFTAVRFTEANEFGTGNGGSGHQHNGTDSLQYVNIPYLSRVIKTNLAGLASLAMAPETPSVPLEVINSGNGTDIVLLWSRTNTEPDFGGYRVAYRYVDSLFYEQIFSVGNDTTFTLTGLTPEQPIYVCYSALDTVGNESIFSIEQLVLPSITPAQPQGFDATSTTSGVYLTWNPNTELDLDGYRISREDPDGIIMEFNLTTFPTEFFDNTIASHILYRYSIQARDINNNFSSSSQIERGQLATHDSGIMIIDESKDGPGISLLLPSDEQVDDYYDNILSGFNITAEWDVADSIQSGIYISDADMAVYSSIVLHTDVRFPIIRVVNDTLEIRKYFANGGNLFMSGWQLIGSITNQYELSNNFYPGDFVYDVMMVDSIENAVTNDFRGADPQISGYPGINVDPNKVPANFNGDLETIDVLKSTVNSVNTEVIYTYRSSQQPPSVYDGMPVALKNDESSSHLAFIEFPLYYMNQVEAKELIKKVLNDFGEVTGIENDEGENQLIPDHYILHQNFPNPFNPSTTIKYEIPNTSKVSLKVFNTIGEEILLLVNEEQDAGLYEIDFDATGLASGIYFYKLIANNFVQTKKMILIK